jgi:hypothetical protein
MEPIWKGSSVASIFAETVAFLKSGSMSARDSKRPFIFSAPMANPLTCPDADTANAWL